jgi:nucleotide-binding universal stress UspA family protein
MRILLAIDGSECSSHAVNYAAEMLRGRPDAEVMLFHVLAPLPPGLREHGGSENPKKEKKLEAKLQQAQRDWYALQRKAEQGILQKARMILVQAGLKETQVQVKLGYEDNIARNILETARAERYDTIVVGRHARTGIKQFTLGEVTKRLIRSGGGLTIWIVE